MKKILIQLTGIVFLIAILIAGSCKPPDPTQARGPKEVKIHLKAVKKDGKKHLKMYDSNHPKKVVVDTLETIVMPGDTVVWKLRRISRIRNIEKIGPKTPGTIIYQDAEPIPGTKYFRLIIPIKATEGQEKYDIIFKDKDGKLHVIDPYLKIPPE